jgi:hypothetical protein
MYRKYHQHTLKKMSGWSFLIHWLQSLLALGLKMLSTVVLQSRVQKYLPVKNYVHLIVSTLKQTEAEL